MLNSRTVSIALAAALALVGAIFLLQAEEPAGGSLQLTVNKPTINVPESICGTASTIPEDVVEVTAEIDGVPLEGSPDLDMEGPANEFSFPVTEEMRGRDVIVTATATDGTIVTKVVHIN